MTSQIESIVSSRVKFGELVLTTFKWCKTSAGTKAGGGGVLGMGAGGMLMMTG